MYNTSWPLSNSSQANSSLKTIQLDFPNWTTTKNVVLVTMYAIILVISSIGNLLVLVVVHRNKSRRIRTVSDLFLLNMATSDLLITLFNIPILMKNIMARQEWPSAGIIGNVLCSLTTLLFYLSIDVSLLSLVAISVERFLLVFFPRKRFVTMNAARAVIGATWITGIVFTTPLVFTTKLEELLWRKSCIVGIKLATPFSYHIAYFAIFIVLPMLTMFILYPAIAVKLWLRRIPGNHSQVNRENRQRQNRKVLCMLLTVIILFSLCWVPYWSVVIACKAGAFRSCSQLSHLRVLAFANCALNPLVYTIFNRNIKNGLYQIFHSCCCVPFRRRRRTNQICVMTLHRVASVNCRVHRLSFGQCKNNTQI